MLTLTSACARSPDTPALNERPAAADTHPARISMTELQKRILDYSDSLRSRTDISPEKFSAAIGVTLIQDERVSIKRIAKDLATTDGYDYGASYLSVESAREFPSQEVIFYQRGEQPVTDAPTGVCYWDADSAGRALEALGYRTGGEAPFQKGGIRQYWRPTSDGNQGMDTSLLTYRSNEGDAARTCVYAVQFGGGDR
ncbi:TPA: hypothetical protein QDZ75_001963 [Stenotrophomonas maltophilia]|jgi:hypothetical protein|nr:hypothetical protein [Stenotrophomonas maltophilia]